MSSYSCEINKLVRTAMIILSLIREIIVNIMENSFTYEGNHSEHHVEGDHNVITLKDSMIGEGCHVKRFHDSITLRGSLNKLDVILAGLSC